MPFLLFYLHIIICKQLGFIDTVFGSRDSSTISR